METNKFTPGPWSVSQYMDDLWVSPGPKHEKNIAKIVNFGGEAYQANAYLVSAAPDLLEALEKLRAAFVVAVGDKSPFAKVALGITDSAINKAKGL